MSRIFVAGATGVIGRRLVPLLVAAGHQVIGATRRDGAAEWLRTQGAQPVVIDVYDTAAMVEAVREAAPDVVMHQLTDLAGGVGSGNARIRQEGTRSLVDAARAAGVRRIVAQSIAWAYGPGPDPAAEPEPLDQTSIGDRRATVAGVAALENAVSELPEWVVLRYGLLYGPGTWYASDGAMGAKVRNGELSAGPDIASFVHVDDAAAAALAALDWPTGPVNICDDEPAPGWHWLPAFAAAVGASASLCTHDTETERAAWARGADNRHARITLGWTPLHSTWREGFATSLGPAPLC